MRQLGCSFPFFVIPSLSYSSPQKMIYQLFSIDLKTSVGMTIRTNMYSWSNRLGKAVWGLWYTLTLPSLLGPDVLLSQELAFSCLSLPVARLSAVVWWSEFMSTEDKEGISALILSNHLYSDVNGCSRDEGPVHSVLCHLVSCCHPVPKRSLTLSLSSPSGSSTECWMT